MEDDVKAVTRVAIACGFLGGVVPIVLTFVFSQPDTVKILVIVAGIGVFGVPCLLLRTNKDLSAESGTIMRSFCWVLTVGTFVLSALVVTANYYWSDIPPSIEASTNQWSNSHVGEFAVIEPKLSTLPSAIKNPETAMDVWSNSDADKGRDVQVVGTIKRNRDQPGTTTELLVQIFPATIYLTLHPGPVAAIQTFLWGWLVFLYAWLALLLVVPWADEILKPFRMTPTGE